MTKKIENSMNSWTARHQVAIDSMRRSGMPEEQICTIILRVEAGLQMWGLKRQMMLDGIAFEPAVGTDRMIEYLRPILDKFDLNFSDKKATTFLRERVQDIVADHEDPIEDFDYVNPVHHIEL